ncbi:uncharacterized protein B0H64DRAFT_398776 [Chaetomium fimeti]|uniref:Uncharacterized protein n=1 Tax=Chaetomium fimeti TaxID=1854472 RepID=A0AAE0HDX6_9PEZI|nr:hypothetical protein B0H64DRAFT_398776 [Chaetomium fimeti]
MDETNMAELEMAQEVDDEFSRLWQRHLTALRDDFSATSVQALPSLPSESRSFDEEAAPDRDLAHPWDDKIGSVVDMLDELTLQSPNTTDTHSPETPWFPDRDGYPETALSSPLNSSWPRTIGSPKNPCLPYLRVEDYSETPFPDLKGKGVDIAQTWSQRKPPPPWHEDATVPFLLQKQFLHDHPPSLAPLAAATATSATTTTTTIHTPTTSNQPRPPATQVHALILTWGPPPPPTTTPSQHDTHERQFPVTPNPNNGGGDTDALRATLKRRGYRVQCRTIPADYPTAAVETMLDRFLARSAMDTLLVVYYRGWGCLERDGRMVFASGPDPGASSFFWEDVRDPVMQVPGDVLLVFDCTALPGVRAEQLEMRIEAGMVSSPSTKQLLGVCVPSWYYDDEWSGGMAGDDMTQSLCRALDGMGDVPVLSVHRLCSLMREDLRGSQLASRVFVSQLGGGRLLDIYLPRLAASPTTRRQSMSPW